MFRSRRLLFCCVLGASVLNGCCYLRLVLKNPRLLIGSGITSNGNGNENRQSVYIWSILLHWPEANRKCFCWILLCFMGWYQRKVLWKTRKTTTLSWLCDCQGPYPRNRQDSAKIFHHTRFFRAVKIMSEMIPLSLWKGWKICFPNYYYVYAPSILLGTFWYARISLDTNCDTNEWMARWRHFQSLARSSSNYESDYDSTFSTIVPKDYISRFWVVRNQSQGSSNRKFESGRLKFLSGSRF